MWTKEKSWAWYQKQPWIVGFNYLPASAINSTEMWQKEDFDIQTIERELRAASKIGYNACRVFLQYLLWKANKKELFECFEVFLDISNRYGIKVMPVLFDDCAFSFKEPYLGVQDEPVKGIHNSGWTPSPGFLNADNPKERPFLKEYVTDFLNRYGKDDRILLWDLYNEMGNSDRKEKSLDLLQDTFAWARTCEPEQPLTACVWKFEDFDYVCAELSDIISFHDYLEMEVTRERVEAMEAYGRPILCTEWLHRINGNSFATHMHYYKEKAIGIFNWGLAAGKSQTYLNWDSTKNPTEGEPKIWQHDIFRQDLTPYSREEIELIASLIG